MPSSAFGMYEVASSFTNCPILAPFLGLLAPPAAVEHLRGEARAGRLVGDCGEALAASGLGWVRRAHHRPG